MPPVVEGKTIDAQGIKDILATLQKDESKLGDTQEKLFTIMIISFSFIVQIFFLPISIYFLDYQVLIIKYE